MTPTSEPPLWKVPAHYRWSQARSPWEWFEVFCIPTPLWRLQRRLRHPVRTFHEHWFYWQRPKVGGYLMYHDEGPYQVVARDGDDLTIIGPHGRQTVSWMNCCDPVRKS